MPSSAPSATGTSPWPDCTLSRVPAHAFLSPTCHTGTPPESDPVDSEDEPYLPVSTHRCTQHERYNGHPASPQGAPDGLAQVHTTSPRKTVDIVIVPTLSFDRFRNHCLRCLHSIVPKTTPAGCHPLRPEKTERPPATPKKTNKTSENEDRDKEKTVPIFTPHQTQSGGRPRARGADALKIRRRPKNRPKGANERWIDRTRYRSTTTRSKTAQNDPCIRRAPQKEKRPSTLHQDPDARAGHTSETKQHNTQAHPWHSGH